MSPDRFDSGSRSRRNVWSHWVPLAATLTIATVGVAAWAWSQRKTSEDEDLPSGLDYDNSAEYASQDDRPEDNDQTYGVEAGPSEGWGAKMSGALRRTPSPQHFIDSTGKTVAAGFAAAGAAMGKALASIREEDKFESNPWSEEADAKRERAPVSSNKRRKTVVIVVSANSQFADDDYEHASILSHIPHHNDPSSVKLVVLVYAPGLKDTALDTTTSNLPPPSLSSSYSNIGHEATDDSASVAFQAVYSQALSLVDKKSMVIPFTTANGHVHILRHINPEVIYLQESMAGEGGSIITNLQTWLRHDVILVVGAESGSGGLVDSESEAEKSDKEDKWWQKPERVGRGRGIVVVDGMRVNDDWARRVQGHE